MAMNHVRGHVRVCFMLLLMGSSWGGVMLQPKRVSNLPRVTDLQQKASFMPKSDLLKWINGLLHLDYTRVEQCANGAAYCQIIDSLFTEEFPLKKVSFTAKSENHSIKNYKVLQQFFMQKGIDKTIDVDKLIKGRPMDNLEFLQWLRGFFEDHRQAGVEYDAAARRRALGITFLNGGPAGPAGRQGGGTITGGRASTVSPVMNSLGPISAASPARAALSSAPGARASSVQGLTPGANKAFASPAFGSPRLHTPEPAVAQAEQFRLEVEALQHTVGELEKERDFYYGKLRSVELLCQTTEDSPQAPESVVAICKEILGVMYAESGEDDDTAELSGGRPLHSPEPHE